MYTWLIPIRQSYRMKTKYSLAILAVNSQRTINMVVEFSTGYHLTAP